MAHNDDSCRHGLVYVVVLNWNGWRDTADCITSLLKLEYEDAHLLVVDNGSTDQSVTKLREKFPQVQILETGTNLGFAGGNNVGIRHALARGAEFVWLVNNDAKVDGHALTAMVATARLDPQVGVVGSVVYHMDAPQTIQYWGGGRISLWLGRSWAFTSKVKDSRLEYLSGASMLLRVQALADVGLLDDEFFMYWEDSDLCLRLRGASWRLAVAKEAKIWHKQCASTGKKSIAVDLLMKESMVRFLKKHSPVPSVAIFLGVSLMLVNRVVQCDWVRIRALIRDIPPVTK